VEGVRTVPVDPKQRLSNERWDGEWKYCPLRDEASPEYRLLLATIHEEIEKCMEKLTSDHRALLYSRINMFLIGGSIIAAVIRFH
jgi:hypothetical protein